MSYDFVIHAVTTPAGIQFPVSLDTLMEESPEALLATIEDSAEFLQLLAEYPGMAPIGSTHPSDDFIYEGKRFRGSGFRVHAVYKLPAGFAHDVSRLNFNSVQQYLDLQAVTRTHPLQGIHLDMQGSRFDVLDLYAYLRRSFDNLLILDKQTGMFHDERSFAQFLAESGSR